MKLFDKKLFRKKEEKVTETQKFGKNMDFVTSEAYNLLRTNISFALPAKEEGGRVIAVTSSNPHEGKSFTSLNFAYTLAAQGHYNVLLVDCDMRKPTIAEKLGIKNDPGLSDALAGRCLPNVQACALSDKLSVLTSGVIPPNPSELIGSEMMGKAVANFAQHYDFVILDLPPVNSVADPLLVSKFVDGYVLVVHHNSSKRAEINETIRRMRFVNAHVLGFVYNGNVDSVIGSTKRRYYKYKEGYGYAPEASRENKA